MRLMEAAAAAVALVEPLLLVGEAGTGKTALLQHLARKVRHSQDLSQAGGCRDAFGGKLRGGTAVKAGCARRVVVSKIVTLNGPGKASRSSVL